jgi:hypothetical protein
MKVGKWWVSRGVLASGNDPTVELGGAAEQFGDEYAPMLFMSGDGHRTPGFLWATRGCWEHFFDDAINANKVCCYVETFSDRVTADMVPASFQAVYGNHKVFGWELGVFRNVQRVIDWILEWIPKMHEDVKPDLNDIQYVTREMYIIYNSGYLRAEGVRAMKWRDVVRADNGFRSDELLQLFLKWVKDYQRATIRLRVDPAVHRAVGGIIQRQIDQFSDHFHFISCGDAHVNDVHNPLYKFITPPPGIFGVADPEKD